MRLILGVVFAVFLSFALGDVARAGALGSPLDGDPCGALDTADLLDDPNGEFDGADTPEKCEKYCKKAGKQCNKYVKDSYSCLKRTLSESEEWDKVNCTIIFDDNADIKECKQSVAGGYDESYEELKLDRDDELDECDEWAEQCAATCLIVE